MIFTLVGLKESPSKFIVMLSPAGFGYIANVPLLNSLTATSHTSQEAQHTASNTAVSETVNVRLVKPSRVTTHGEPGVSSS